MSFVNSIVNYTCKTQPNDECSIVEKRPLNLAEVSLEVSTATNFSGLSYLSYFFCFAADCSTFDGW